MGTTQENDQHEYDNYSDFIKSFDTWIKILHSIPWICTVVIYKLKINKSQIDYTTLKYQVIFHLSYIPKFLFKYLEKNIDVKW